MMGDMGEVFNALRALDKTRRKANYEKANPEGWTMHTDYHWSQELNGKRLDYWPSRRKFQYAGRLMTGDVAAFIAKRTAK